jgi:hypothetical protein
MMLYALICKFAHFMKIYCRFTTVPLIPSLKKSIVCLVLLLVIMFINLNNFNKK